jgi:RNA polymerase sigma-70 factor (ECF subfamily)
MGAVRYIVGTEIETWETAKPATYDDVGVRRLVESAAAGNIESFGEIYSIYLDRIYRYVIYQVRDKATAEDLSEEILWKAWRGLAKYRWDGHPFSAWLYRIAHNQIVDYFRTNRKYQNIEVESLAGDTDPEQEVSRKQMERLLVSAVSSLPEQQRQVIILKFIEGLDNQEIEQIMGKKQGAIRMLQMRALTTLRQKLSGKR